MAVSRVAAQYRYCTWHSQQSSSWPKNQKEVDFTSLTFPLSSAKPNPVAMASKQERVQRETGLRVVQALIWMLHTMRSALQYALYQR
jgi:hypothetical protein